MSVTEVRVCYPAGADIVLRSSHDWERDLEPVRVDDDGRTRVFSLPRGSGPVYFKPIRRHEDRSDWSLGTNYLAHPGVQAVYPHFDGGTVGRITDKLRLSSGRCVRVYLPPGYDENHLKRYPVLYALDGANLFFPDEAFSGTEWGIDDAFDCLNAMNLVDKVIVVALYSDGDERENEYTQPGYTAFGIELAEQVLPDIERRFRTLANPENTAILGASLEGVAALYLAWTHPDCFGMAACISSTFGFRDDLLQRVWTEPAPDIKVYLDSGWPRDNDRVTHEMYDALVHRGFEPGRDVLFLGFPGALHHEKAWAQRVHLPIQFFFGRAFRRVRNGHG
jgi:predicted alpha/beta superfamily hydrolase